MPQNDFEAPIMPTGSGVADLEVAWELDALANGQGETPEAAPTDEAASGPLTESEAHPS